MAKSQDAHSVILNFLEPSTGSTLLNLGADQTNVVDAQTCCLFTADIQATYQDKSNFGQVDATLDLGFLTDFTAQFGSTGYVDTRLNCGFDANLLATDFVNTAVVDATVQTQIVSNTNALFDINFQLGIFNQLQAHFEVGIEQSYLHQLPFSKPIPKALQRAFSFARSLGLSHGLTCAFEQTQSLTQAIKMQFEQATGLRSGIEITWQENRQIKIDRTLAWDITTQKYCDVATRWVELAHQRKQFTYSHDVAQHFEKTYRFGFDRGLDNTFT